MKAALGEQCTFSRLVEAALWATETGPVGRRHGRGVNCLTPREVREVAAETHWPALASRMMKPGAVQG